MTRNPPGPPCNDSESTLVRLPRPSVTLSDCYRAAVTAIFEAIYHGLVTLGDGSGGLRSAMNRNNGIAAGRHPNPPGEGVGTGVGSRAKRSRVPSDQVAPRPVPCQVSAVDASRARGMRSCGRGRGRGVEATDGMYTRSEALVEFPIQLVGRRLPHQLCFLPHQLHCLPHQFPIDFEVFRL